MKPVDEQINRLMKAAARAPKAGADTAKFALEARVLGDWRSSTRAESGELLVIWFRRAAICAGLLALAGLAWSHHDLSHRSSGELVADSAMRMGVEP